MVVGGRGGFAGVGGMVRGGGSHGMVRGRKRKRRISVSTLLQLVIIFLDIKVKDGIIILTRKGNRPRTIKKCEKGAYNVTFSSILWQ